MNPTCTYMTLRPYGHAEPLLGIDETHIWPPAFLKEREERETPKNTGGRGPQGEKVLQLSAAAGMEIQSEGLSNEDMMSSIPGISLRDCINANLSQSEAVALRTEVELERVKHWQGCSLDELKQTCASLGMQTAGTRNELIVKLALGKELPVNPSEPMMIFMASAPAAYTVPIVGPPIPDVAAIPVPVPPPPIPDHPPLQGKKPQPRGRPRKGKLWNADVGEWEIDPNYVEPPKGSRTKRGRAPAADGEASSGKKSGSKHRLAPGQKGQPRGRPRKGKLWDMDRGEWVEDPHYVPKPKAPRSAAGPDAPLIPPVFVAAPAVESLIIAEVVPPDTIMPEEPVTINAVLADTPKAVSKTKSSEGGKTPQPRGRPPNGKTWNAEAGEWEADPHYQPKESKAAKPKAMSPVTTVLVEGVPASDLINCSIMAIEDITSAPAASKGPGNNKPKKALPPGKKPQPRGRPPKGKAWDYDNGCWVEAPADDTDDPEPQEPPMVPPVVVPFVGAVDGLGTMDVVANVPMAMSVPDQEPHPLDVTKEEHDHHDPSTMVVADPVEGISAA